MGWNSLSIRPGARLFAGISNNSFVYFTHAYRAPVTTATVAVTDYGEPFSAAVEHGNIMGVQFQMCIRDSPNTPKKASSSSAQQRSVSPMPKASPLTPKRSAPVVSMSEAPVIKTRGPQPSAAVRRMKEYHPPLGDRSGLRLDFNENTFACSPRVLEALSRISRADLTRYPERESVENRVAAHLGLKPQQLLLTNGVDEAIHLLCQTYLEADTEILLPVPTYTMYEVYASGTPVSYTHLQHYKSKEPPHETSPPGQSGRSDGRNTTEFCVRSRITKYKPPSTGATPTATAQRLTLPVSSAGLG